MPKVHPVWLFCANLLPLWRSCENTVNHCPFQSTSTMPAESGMAGISTIEPGGRVATLPAPLKAPIKDLLRMYLRVTGNQ